jgi:intein/homing endonuclease
MSFSSLAISASARAGKQSEKDVNIIEFVESPWGLKMKLFPVQRVILKAHYGLELSGEKSFEISDWRRENVEVHSEKSYLKKLYDEGRCNIGEVIPGKQRREMILSIGRRSGKCVLGDTLILTDKGIIPIEELGDPQGDEYQLLSTTVAQEGVKKRSQSKFFFNGGVRSVNKIQTRYGYSLGGTDNHRIKVMNGEGHIVWGYMSDLQEGDYVAIHKNTDLWARDYFDLTPYQNDIGRKTFEAPKVLDEELGLLLGLLVGDGGWTNSSSVSFTADDPETRECAERLFHKFFGVFSFTPDKRTKRTGAIRHHSVSARRFLNDIGWTLETDRYSKKTPFSIMRSPKSVVCAFLKGCFETDGFASKSGREISFSTACYRLAQEVQVLLLNLGIVSKIQTKHNKKTLRDYHEVILRGLKSRQLFRDHIGFVSERKNSRLIAGLEGVRKEGGVLLSVPCQRTKCSELLASTTVAKPNKGWSRTKLRSVLGNTIKPNSKEELTYTRIYKALELNTELDMCEELLSHFQKLSELDYFFDPIVSIQQDEQPVYDLNVPDGSMFVANGMTNHNTTISACIAAYETYKLIKKGDPQSYYGLPSSNNIQIISVATDKDQAGLLYQEVSGHYRNCSFFGPYTANNTLSYARFQTPADVEKYGRYIETTSAKATLKVTFRSCVAKGLRGAGNICVILDEVAHFTESGQSGAEEVYNAVVPSTSAYSAKDPENLTIPIGEVEGRIILISSPLGRQGLFYKLFQIGMRGGKASENILAVQAPTWEVNPTVPAEEFEKHYLKNSAVFFTEYGGEFTDRTRGWIEKSEDLFACVNPKLRARLKAPARQPHYMGIDLGLVGDGTAVAIGHLEEDTIIVDLVTQIKAGEGDYEDQDRLDFDDVADWIFDLTKKFYVVEGIFDQWAGIPLEQALSKRGMGQMKSVQMSKQLTSQIFQNFKDMMWDERLGLYDDPSPEENGHEPYIQEILELQAKVQSKHIITVEAPQIQGKHDDMSDALTRMVWLASQQVGKQRHFAGGSSGRSSINGVALHGGKGFAGSPRLRGGTDPRRRATSTTNRNQKYSIRNRIAGKKR